MNILVALNHSLSQTDVEAVRDTIALVPVLIAAGHAVTVMVHAEGIGLGRSSKSSLPPQAKIIAVHVNHMKFFPPRKNFLNQLHSHLLRNTYDRTIAMGLFPDMDLCIAYPEEIQYDKSMAERIENAFYERRKNYISVLRPPSVALVCCLSSRQKFKIANEDLVASERLCALPPGLDPAIFSHDAFPKNEERQSQRVKMDILPETIAILQISDSWQDSGVDRSLNTISIMPEPWRKKCHFYLAGNENEEICRQRLVEIAENSNFPMAQCHYINMQRYSIDQLLKGMDIYIEPARKDPLNEYIVQALALGIPVICTDLCGYANYVQMACCPVIPSPFQYETIQDALAFIIPSLTIFQRTIRRFALKRDFCLRAHALAKIACEYHPVADHTQEFTSERVQAIIKIHLANIHQHTALKDEPKRAVSRVSYEGMSYIVKEFRKRPWWHLKNQFRRSINGTHILRSFTPYCWGQYKDRKTGSNFLIFRDCGTGNFYYPEYAKRPDASELYSACGKILALLHNAGLYHADTKPANFVENVNCQDEVTNRVCLIDCDNVTAYPGVVPTELRIRNVAQFVAGTGKVAELNITQWQSLIEAFRQRYQKVSLMNKKEGDRFWSDVWDVIRKDDSIEQTLPAYMLK